MARDYSVSKGIVGSDQYVYREERDLTKTDVDWAAVSKTLVTDIEKMRDDRETTKAEIETKTREQMAEFDKLEQYANKTLNVTMLKGANEAKNFLMTQNSMMKRGFGTPADYQVSKQTVSDNFTQLKKVTENADKVFQDLQKRTNSQIPGQQNNIFERMLGELNAGFAEMSGQDLVMNPQTGNMSFVKTGSDRNDPANHMSIAGLDQRMSQQSDYVSLTKDASSQVEALADVINVKYITENQGVKTIEDWYALDGTKEMLARMVDTVTSSDAQVMSILQDSNYTKDDFTQSREEADADPKKIFYTPDPSGSGLFKFELNESQQKTVDEKAEAAIRSMINRKEDFQKGFAEQQDTATTIGEKDRTLRAKGFYGEVVSLVTGSATEATAAATALASRVNSTLPEGSPKVGVITRSADGKTWIVPRSGEADFTIKATLPDGSEKSSVQISKELFEEVNPYITGGNRIDIIMAQDAYGLKNVPTERQIGAAQAEVRKELIPEFDFNSSIRVDGADVGPQSFLESKLGLDFDDVDASGGNIESAFKTVIDELLPPALREIGYELGATDAGSGDGAIQIIFGDRNAADFEDHFYTISDTNIKSIAEAFTELQEILNQERDQANKKLEVPGGMGAYN